MIIAALISLAVLAALVVFQLLLIAGKPLGEYTQGGQRKVLSTPGRVFAAFSIATYAAFAMFIASKTGWSSFIQSESVLNTGMWVLTVYAFIGIAMNGISRSKKERNIMTPVCVVLAVCFLVLAVN